MTSKICKCGHEEKKHELRYGCFADIPNSAYCCKCKKFKPSPNHSPQGVQPEDTPSGVAVHDSGKSSDTLQEGTFNLSSKRKKLLRKIAQEFSAFKCAESRVTAPQKAMYVLGLIKEQDREFIKRLRFKFKAFIRTKDADVVDAIIDKLAGEELSR